MHAQYGYPFTWRKCNRTAPYRTMQHGCYNRAGTVRFCACSHGNFNRAVPYRTVPYRTVLYRTVPCRARFNVSCERSISYQGISMARLSQGNTKGSKKNLKPASHWRLNLHVKQSIINITSLKLYYTRSQVFYICIYQFENCKTFSTTID